MKSKSKFIIGAMIFVALIFSSSIFIYEGILSTVNHNEEMTVQSFKEEQFKVIWSSLNKLCLQSEKEITEISANIEAEILELSEDKLNKLQDDMSNDIHNDDLHEIIMGCIDSHGLNDINNHRNGVVIMSSKGYIEDFNYRRATYTTDNSRSRFWDYSIENSYNKELEQNAINKLLNRTSGIIALESYDLIYNEDHIKIKEMTYKTLSEVFLKEGMEGLRNYQIFVPYYITDIGDIFGTPDITQGIKVENNKIIVVQEFNLYDQIMSSQDDLFDDEQIEDLMYRYDELLRWLYIFGLALITAVCGLIFYFCSMYNKLIVQDEINDIHDQETPVTITEDRENEDA